MKVRELKIPGVLLFTPSVHTDDRGYFYESFSKKTFKELTGLHEEFVQDNHSTSSKGVLRGLHYQIKPNEQGKLVRVIEGAVYDVVVDIRPNSPTFGTWVGTTLSSNERQQLWIPPGFAHGFIALTQSAQFVYKTTKYYAKESERTILWNDPDLSIDWPDVGMDPHLSTKDASAPQLKDAQVE